MRYEEVADRMVMAFPELSEEHVRNEFVFVDDLEGWFANLLRDVEYIKKREKEKERMANATKIIESMSIDELRVLSRAVFWRMTDLLSEEYCENDVKECAEFCKKLEEPYKEDNDGSI